jgi:hypothetical protein
MEAYAVSTLVNGFVNDGPELIVPVTPRESPQLSLF